MTLHAQRTIDTRGVRWPQDRLTSNDRKGKAVHSADTVALWRGLGYQAFRRVPPIPEGAVARVVVYYRQPKGRNLIRDAGNCHPMTKALVDGMTHGPRGKGVPRLAGLWPDDSQQYVVGQDDRLMTPGSQLEVIVQVWTTTPRDD